MNQAKAQPSKLSAQRASNGARWGGLLLILTVVALAGCSSSNAADREAATGGEAETVIQNGGSDTMLNLAQMWSEAYTKQRPRVKVNVTGGGSGVGIRDLTRSMVTIANASRNIADKERDQAVKNTGLTPVEFIVGYDAIAIYVHKDNPITEITVDQLAGIYGEERTITRWSQLGISLPDDEIILFGRMNSSGTYDYFRERVLKKKDFRLNIHSMSGSKDVVELVGQTLGGIGYSGMGYKTDEVRFVPVAKEKGAKPWMPTVETVHDKRYPLARSLNMYTLGAPQGETKAYLEWILSATGQGIVARAGYIPVDAAKD